MGSTRRKVLVIDDDASVCAFISKTLVAKGIDVFMSSDPQEGIRIADAERPDLLFISLLLTGSNGLKLSKAVHAIDHLRTVPVVMLISYAGELDPKYTSTIGIIDVFVKPLKEPDFVTRTLALLDRFAAEGGLPHAGGAGARGIRDDEEITLPAEDAEDAGLEIEPHGDSPGLFAYPEHEVSDEKHTAEKKGEPMGYEFNEMDDQEEKHPDFGEPDRIEPDHYSHQPEKQHHGKRILIIVVACIMLAGIVLGAYFAKRYFSGTQQAKAPSSAAAPEKPAAPVEPASKEPQPAPPAVPAAPPETAPKKAEEAAPAPKTAPAAEAKHAPAAKAVEPAKLAAQKTAQKAEPSKAAEKALKAKPAAPAATAGTFSVQTGIFENEKNAVSLAEKLKQKGYAATVTKDSADPKKARYRVLVGSFDTNKKAAIQAKAITEKDGIKAFVHKN